MKKLVALTLFLLAAVVLADGNVPTNTPGATAVAVTANQAATTCVSNAAAAAAQATATVPAVAGQFFYVTMLEIQYGAIAAPTATLLATTSSNLPGSPTWNDAAPAATFQHDLVIPFMVPLKSSVVGTATVITGNTGVASISQNIKLCGFYAP
jgi:hypothetical protein